MAKRSDPKALATIRKVLTEAGYGSMNKGPTGNPCLGKLVRQILYPTPVRRFAADAGLHPSTLNKIVAGQRNISMSTLARVAPFVSNPDLRAIIAASVDSCSEDDR